MGFGIPALSAPPILDTESKVIGVRSEVLVNSRGAFYVEERMAFVESPKATWSWGFSGAWCLGIFLPEPRVLITRAKAASFFLGDINTQETCECDL